MSEPEVERQVGDLTVKIDRDLCVGFADCIKGAETAFELDADGVVVFKDLTSISRDQLITACDACPVDAITVCDVAGIQLAPS